MTDAEIDASIARLWEQGWKLRDIERTLRIGRAETDAFFQRRNAHLVCVICGEPGGALCEKHR